MAGRQCECGCGQATADGSFAPGHESEALRMLLHLEGVLDHDEPVVEFLHRRGYGRGGRNLRRAIRDRLFDDAPPPPADGSTRLQTGQLTEIARRLGEDVLKRPVTVGREHRSQLQYVTAPDEPGVYVLSEGDRAVFVGRIGNLHKRLGQHRSGHPRVATLAGRMARIKTGRTASKSGRSASNAMHLHATDEAFREAFDEAVDRIRGMEVRYVTVPEDEDTGTLQALLQLHAAVELGTLELCGGGYNSFRNV